MPREKYWGPDPKRLERVKQEIDRLGATSILDVGPGYAPLPWATHSIFSTQYWYNQNHLRESNASGQIIDHINCDFLAERLPFNDKRFDFVYCRHVIEDLHNPEPLLKEMQRIGRAGYIECPSPVAELCFGVDAEPLGRYYRGYMHHLWIVWTEGETLCLTPKYTLAQVVPLELVQLESLLNRRELWNVGAFWQDSFKWRILLHERDYVMQGDYSSILTNAIYHATGLRL